MPYGGVRLRSYLGCHQHKLELKCLLIVRNVLHSAGLNARTPRKKPYISEVNRKRRLDLAMKYKNKPMDFWKKWSHVDMVGQVDPDVLGSRLSPFKRLWQGCLFEPPTSRSNTTLVNALGDEKESHSGRSLRAFIFVICCLQLAENPAASSITIKDPARIFPKLSTPLENLIDSIHFVRPPPSLNGCWVIGVPEGNGVEILLKVDWSTPLVVKEEFKKLRPIPL
ncbi:hypothetical protein TNCV_2734571 [Trichonephila clavipes]|nr:hypothetical protein TNCV_2734571 [Trichonephila clavipes]